MVRAVFLHLPKTAGTSFRDILCRGFGAEAVSPPFNASRLSGADAASLGAYDVVSGHISWTDVRAHFPEARTFTILRDPIDRCLSWYYFARMNASAGHADVEAAHACDVETFFSLDPAVTFRNIFNRQVRQLGDHVLNTEVDLDAALEQAKRTLADCVWVGRQESLDHDVARLGTCFPELAGMAAPSLNVTAARRPLAEVGPDLIERIASYNRYDLELYRHLSARLDGAA